jgi:predicted RecB family nuclease
MDPGQSAGRDQVYLYGYGIHDRTKDTDWRTAHIDSFGNYDDTDEAEYEVLLNMWQLLEKEVAKAESANQTIGIFHYSHHEKMWWRNFANRHEGKPGVPTVEAAEAFMAKYFVDLLPYAEQISFPTMSYSIKSLAPVAGFAWKAQDAGGVMSLLKYKAATANDVDEKQKMKQSSGFASTTWMIFGLPLPCAITSGLHMEVGFNEYLPNSV